MERKWQVAPKIEAEEQARFPKIPPTVLQLLLNRGLRDEAAIAEFFNPDYDGSLHDPFLFKEMRRAVERIFAAVKNREKILIHGDYDADGICAATIVFTLLRALDADVRVFLPHREADGYGLNRKNLEGFLAERVKLIVTCDCGIANAEEISFATARGADVIVTDHHAMPSELPKAWATIHPGVPGETYPYRGLAGGGVAFKLAQAVIALAPENGFALPNGFEKWLLDLTAISSVADMVPLLGETRALVKYGLIVLAKTRRPGLRKLMESAGIFDGAGATRRPIDTGAIGFQIAPRLNAAGRLRHAEISFKLLTAETPEAATALAAELEAANADRQRQTEICLAEARAAIKEMDWEHDPAIVVAGEWPPGLVGLVAGKLMDEYYRPVFAISNREIAVGSGRSIPEYHVVEAMKTFADVFEKFGGHPQACGFTVKPGMIDELRRRLRAHAAESFNDRELAPSLFIDAEVTLEAVTWGLCETLRKFEPYGIGNFEPRFLARGLRVLDAAAVGAEGKHLRLAVAHHSGESRKMIAFGFGARRAEFAPGSAIDAVFTVGVNEWNGNRELQLKVVDIRMGNREQGT